MPTNETKLAVFYLANLLEWAKGNRGSKSINPYTVPEVKEALLFLASLESLNNIYDVDTKKLSKLFED